MAEPRGAGPAWVGIDLGTQSVRVLAVDDDGRTLAAASRRLSSHREGRRHEQDPESWWSSVADALAEVCAALAGPVGGVATCSTSGTLLLADRSGRPLTPGVMYDDGRAQGAVDRVAEAGRDVWDRLGYRMQASWALPKLVHLLTEVGGSLPRGARVLHQGDVIAERLVGSPVATDSSQALKTGVDLETLQWPAEVLDRLGVSGALLPEVVLPGTVLGTVCPAAAERTGLPVGTAVVAGMTDGCAAQLGAGALAPGEWNSVLGTTLVLKGVTAGLLRDPSGAVYSHRAPHQGVAGTPLWLPGGASSTGAGTVSALFPDADLARLTAAAAELLARGEAPVAYPLSGRGERFPFVAPAAEGFVLHDGAVLGLAEHAALAGAPASFAGVLQGIALLERLCFDLLSLLGATVDASVALTGGGSRNRLWNQLRCDVLGVGARIPANAEPALGMAVLAAAGSESEGPGLVERARAMVTLTEELVPRAGQREAAMARHVLLVDALEQQGLVHHELAAHARTRAASTL